MEGNTPPKGTEPPNHAEKDEANIPNFHGLNFDQNIGEGQAWYLFV